ncbi:FAD dependent oxidoreductase [Komagataeibacter europaeus NBRC 3261]|uniref:FAD dependent oxidoreductase n=2 Tax=Komagataeibacter europaeus TaxID=33995 RepID=A0A0D6PX24_KOMEU|nr:FAD dependent oxidoreductase [Komagataeibacter europaeus NBRC 3261]
MLEYPFSMVSSSIKSLPPSLYAAITPPGPDAPVLTSAQVTDTVIIGGGITGLSAALHLAQAGHKAMVLEANAIGWGASGRNGGQVNPGLKYTPAEVERDMGARGHALVEAAWNAPDLVFDLIERHGIECDAARGGTIRAATASGQLDHERTLFNQCRERGGPVTWLDQGDIARHTGTDRYCGGFIDARGGQINPLAYTRGLARAAMDAGAAVHVNSPVLSLRRDGGKWQVRTPAGSVHARQVVFATNGYTGRLWNRLRRTLVPAYSAIVATDPLPESVRTRILAQREVVYELGELVTYYRIDGAGRLLIGGRSASLDLSGPETFPFLQQHARRLWPFMGDVTWRYGWNGQIAITLDHYPHWHEPMEGIMACVGYNGRGVAMATLMGREIARRVEGSGAGDLLLPASPVRPIPAHFGWRIGVAAAVIRGRIMDRLAR